MRPFLLDLTAQYSPGIARAMERAADGLLEVGQSQFEGLARTTHDLALWLAEPKPRSIALIESPLGNSVPVQLQSDLLEKMECQHLSSSGTHLAMAGRHAAAPWTKPPKIVRQRPPSTTSSFFSMKGSPGTHFLKLFDALADRIGRDRFVPVAMMFDDSFRPKLKTSKNRDRLKTRVDEQARRLRYSHSYIEFPAQRLFKVDGGSHVRWRAPVIWGDSDLLAGKRKVNPIFTVAEHCLASLKDLAADKSMFRAYLEQAWAQDTGGTRLEFAPGLMKSVFRKLRVIFRSKKFVT